MKAFPIRVQLLGITNDAAGTKLANYELLNSGKDQWAVLLPVDVDYGEHFYYSGGISFTGAVLKTGEPMEMSIPLKRSSSRGRVTFKLVNDGKLYPILTDYIPPNTNGSLTADEATSTARQLANHKASTQFQAQPALTGQPAKFVEGRWLWVATQGYGRGDIQAKVELAPDGSTNSVNLELLDSRIITP